MTDETPDFFAGDHRSNYERMVAGDPYIADDPQLDAANRLALRRSAAFQAAYVDGDDESAAAHLAALIGNLGENVTLRPPLTVDYGFNISIGVGTFVNSNLTALDVAPITIGAHCQIGPNVQLLTPTHPLDPAERRAGIESAAPITLGDNVWLGGGAIVLPGVSIGENSVIGAGAVVTKDVPANSVAVGNPAKVIRSL